MSSVGEISANQTNAMKKCWLHEKHEHYLRATLFLIQPTKIIYGISHLQFNEIWLS